MWFFKKTFRKEEISRVNPGYEESERRTPFLGKVLLVAMFVVGLFFGWRALDDLGNIPPHPEPISYCSSGFQTAYVLESPVRPFETKPLYEENYYATPSEYYDPYARCEFNALETQAGIPGLFAERSVMARLEWTEREALRGIEKPLVDIEQKFARRAQEYGLSLQEIEAGIATPLFLPEAIRAELQSLRSQRETLIVDRDAAQKRIDGIGADLKALDGRIRGAYEPVLAAYNRSLRWYEFLVFVLQIVFVVPLFWLSFRKYLSLHRAHSPYTVIAIAITSVAVVLLARVILFWMWDLFLARVLEELWRWIQNFELLRSLLYYGGMVLSFGIFGGAVYYLQKRIFDPRRVVIRRFRAKQCPNCQAALELAGQYCPNCGEQIKEKCSVCHADRFVGLPVCPSCGAKQ